MKSFVAGAMLLALVLASRAACGQAPPKRLSDWLLEQPASANAYPLGLSWRVPAEVPVQHALWLELLAQLASDREVRADKASVARLRDWISGLAVTGRVPVAVADARWLQANPQRDPVLLPGHGVVLPQRPATVTVITARGELCAVTQQPGYEVAAYLQSCNGGTADWAWMAQPDGRIQRYGVASWNREAQDEPAPGAWIWAPPRDSGWPEAFSQSLITYLATQGPAPDPHGMSVACVGGAPVITGREAPAAAPGSAAAGFGFVDPTAAVNLGSAPCGQRTPHAANSTAMDLPVQPVATRSRSLEVTTSDWGGVGLLQTPTARMQSAGHFAFSMSRVQPYTQLNVFVQPFDWLEAGFRYTDVGNRLYGPVQLSGGQSYKDKSFDLKVRLWGESAYLPQAAVGLRDIAGTGLFAGEFLVASKRTGSFDWSVGMGWGYVGGRGNLRNPLGHLSPAFDTRIANNSQAGSLNLKSYFRGPASLFGGVQYQTPWERLILKLEYDGNDYQHEPQTNNQSQRSPWNIGIVYRAGRTADLTLGFERGNTLMLGLALHSQLDALTTTKVSDPPRLGVAPVRRQQAPDWSGTTAELARQTAWEVRRVEQRERELQVTFDDAEAVNWRDRVDRAAAVLHRDAPASVDRFALTYRRHGVDVAEHIVDRDAWVRQQTIAVAPSERRDPLVARAPEPAPAGNVVAQTARPKFERGFGPGFIYTLGGPDAFALYQIYVEEQAKFRLRDDTWIDGALRLRLVDNYDRFKFDAPSNLQRVRTFQREYLTTSLVTMPNLQLTHVGRLTDNQYFSVYGGYLESMFAGVGGEWLYRPFASNIAFGVDVNEVKQRGFRQNFEFLDPGYRTATGHATLYWDTGWQGVKARLSAGRYLAGDLGATVQISRTFKNGVEVGAFATKTNVSAAQFGEGSFDKGVFISIPFDAILTKSSSTVGTFLYRPLTRDGGAKLARSVTLFDVTSARSDNTLKTEPAPRPNELSMPADRRDAWQPKIAEPAPYTHAPPRPDAGEWAPGTAHEFGLIEALSRQGFRNVHVEYDHSHRLSVTLAGEYILPLSRAVGRAARTALNMAPLQTREIRIRFAQRSDPAVIYEFFDLPRLGRYFRGALPRSELAEYVRVDYLNPAAREADPLARLDDLEPASARPLLAQLVPETFSLGRVANDVADAARIAADTNWLKAGAVGAGLVLASSALDRTADRIAKDHASARWLKSGSDIGNAIPWLALAGATVAAIDSSDPVRSRTGYAALEAGGASVLVAGGLKYAVGRARPGENAGSHRFNPFSLAVGYDSFPSLHSIVSWAVATPFAKEYDAPWLYGIAAITNFARVGTRRHWLSDTVAGGLLGYGIGQVFWESARNPRPGEARISVGPSGVRVGWDY